MIDTVDTPDNGTKISMAKVGMKVTEDVYGKQTKERLIKAGTVLTSQIIERLCRHGVTYVRIGNNQERYELDSSWMADSVENTVEFREFAQEYSRLCDVLKVELDQMITGSPVRTETILNTVESLTKSSRTQSRVLNFIRYIKQGDDATYAHCLSVSVLCSLFGSWLGVSDEDLYILMIAGMLHDVGKTQIPASILYKPGKLTDEEFAIVKQHTVIGYDLLKGRDIPQGAQMAALMHHEKWDGRGYPMKKIGTAIDKVAMTVAICDVYEAMTADRVYRAKISPFSVIRQFEKGDFGELEYYQVLVFLQRIAEAFNGSKVQLTDGREGKVIQVNKNDLSRPLVQCANGFIDLSTDSSVEIATVL